jgi:hypothetical protein
MMSGLREPQQGGGGIFIVCLGPSNSLFGRTRRKKKVIWDVPRHARDQRDDSETRRNAFATFFTASVLKCSILPPPPPALRTTAFRIPKCKTSMS